MSAFPFLLLPRELRDLIYEYSFCHTVVQEPRIGGYELFRRKIAGNIALLRTCRQVHDESEPFLAGTKNNFIAVEREYWGLGLALIAGRVPIVSAMPKSTSMLGQRLRDFVLVHTIARCPHRSPFNFNDQYYPPGLVHLIVVHIQDFDRFLEVLRHDIIWYPWQSNHSLEFHEQPLQKVARQLPPGRPFGIPNLLACFGRRLPELRFQALIASRDFDLVEAIIAGRNLTFVDGAFRSVYGAGSDE
ncbi:hypothetical protein B0T25DRAFT_569121 [Lasiosphaeria hispida]|uniref:Uncharacterized protein n=1 Tax=Lasiosphaeria hispida TaxID=260671 RepID=A0AAJ0HJW1_9PEZI|nr:hypothetical protein B0T25DRAFT_569121 [Lasiosphaeria hispida]